MNISTLTKAVVASAFIALGSSASASAQSVDLGTVEAGTEYSWPQFVTVTGVYTPKATGPVKFQYTTTQLEIYTAADHNENSKVTGEFSYTDQGKLVTYSQLKADTPYYIFSYAMDAGSLVIYEGTSELKLVSTIPSTDPENPGYYGGKMSASSDYEMVVNFNFPVSFGNVFLVAPDNTRVAVTAKANGSSVGTAIGCDIAPAMMELYKDGKIKDGDEVTLRLLQVTDASDSKNKYNGNGRCDIPFIVAGKPLELVEVIGADRSTVENPFNSYYLPGDENAMIKFVFDGPLATDKTGMASISYGDSDNLDVGVYSEDIPGTHDGNTAIFDFSGKRRRPVDMLPASTPETQPAGLGISFGRLYSPDGQRVYTGSKSNPSGFALSFIVNVLQYTVAADFTPARGSSLTIGQPMEIWVMNGNKISYDAIRFEYKENGEDKYYDMPEADVKEEADPLSEGAMLYTFNVPAIECDENTPVIVRMTGLECADGLDHANDVYGEFKQVTSGISDIASDGVVSFDVYDIAGVQVLSGATRADLSSLAKGVYIINGKKVVIR
ncbi:MAG: T9SS type A sorting domain-containing protein [Muribaculaceae bacterium]|nr:T9SS type A sorting domain-containing protein [Muribaculaceae bacterium]